MPKKIVITGIVFLIVGVMVAGISSALDPSVGMPKAIESSSPCPAVGCASGSCHSYDDIPQPDGVSEMACPEVSCSSVECHAWDTFTTRYYQPSDSSLNVWIIAPVVFVLLLVLIVRKV